ncbi:MAG: PTS fructose transporter subunit IIB [Candidatus Izemoplasmataceae bacterium]
MKIVATTSCPTGIAHTYMAAENMEKEAKKHNAEIKVETAGSIGIENALTKKDIEEADAVIVAADARVEMERFKGKPLKEVSVSYAIKHADTLIQEAVDGKFETYKG